jgi:hypothetical protein
MLIFWIIHVHVVAKLVIKVVKKDENRILSFYQHLYRIYNKHRIITKAVKLGNFSIKLDISVDGINFVSLNSHRYYA